MPARPRVAGSLRSGGRQDNAPSVVLRADLTAVREALKEITGALDRAGLHLEELGSVELVMAEALNNIVEHAYAGTEGEIRLWWTLGPGGLFVRITDTGRAMPKGKGPLAVRTSARDHAAKVPEGGFGWFLITGLARNIVYRRDRSENVLTFRMAVGDASRGLAQAGARQV